MLTVSHNDNPNRALCIEKINKKDLNNILNQNVNVTREQGWQPSYKYYSQLMLNAAV